MSLTRGSILNFSTPDADLFALGHPVVQVLDVKKLGTESATSQGDRYRLVISDGVQYMQAMSTSQMSSVIADFEFRKYTVIRVKNALVNTVKTRRVLIILEFEVAGQPDAMIGEPTDVENSASNSSTAMVDDRTAAPMTTRPIQSPFSAPTPPAYLQRGNAGGTGSINNFGNSGISSALAGGVFHPISSLNPYQSRWCIKARVTAKSPMKEFGKDKPSGGGKLFSIDLLDSHGGQIRATMFKEAAEKFYPIFQVDKVYLISKGQLKLANKQYSRFDCEYEITLNSDAEVQYVGDDEGIVAPVIKFSNIEQIAHVQPNDYVDVIGVVQSVSPIANIVAKLSHKTLTKRSITIVDKTLNSIELTLWGDQAEKYNEEELSNNAIIAVRGCKVSDFNGRTLSTSFSSEIYVNPDRLEAHELRGWWDSQGVSASIEPLSKRGIGGQSGGSGDSKKFFSAIKDENLGMRDKPDFFTVRCTVTYFRKDFEKPPWFPACSNFDHKTGRECGKKVTGQDGAWHCVHCNMDFPHMVPRYALSFIAADATGYQWITAFNTEAEIILSKKASELLEYKEQDNKVAYDQVFADAAYKSYNLRLRAAFDKMADQQQEIRVKCQLVGVQPIDYKTEAKALLAEIEKYH